MKMFTSLSVRCLNILTPKIISLQIGFICYLFLFVCLFCLFCFFCLFFVCLLVFHKPSIGILTAEKLILVATV